MITHFQNQFLFYVVFYLIVIMLLILLLLLLLFGKPFFNNKVNKNI